jgi:DNA-3-methyladenine glycosylase
MRMKGELEDRRICLRRLRRSELPIETVALARFLIGKYLVHESRKGRLSGRIVETEAYLVGDAAAHSYRGMTQRNRSLFLDRGHAYVYFIYGNWYSINVSSETAGIGAGVLIRAFDPTEGREIMRLLPRAAELHRLASGPGCLATAFGIDRRLDGLDLCGKEEIWLGRASTTSEKSAIGNSVRIGVTKEAHRKLRFYEPGNPSVSGAAHLRV